MRLAARVLLLLVAASIALALAAEAGLRLAGVVPTIGLGDVPLGITVGHPTRGWALAPSAAVAYAGVWTRSNRLGLRGAPLGGDAPVAVLALGDELTFGWGVRDDETYPARLEAELHARWPSCGRVVNGGVPGYTSYQGLMLLRELGGALRPAVVAAAFHLNDALLDGPGPGAASVIERALDPWLRRASALYGWARTRRSVPPPGWWTAEARTSPGRYLRDLRAMDAESRRIGATLVLVNVGFAPGLPDPAPRLRRGELESDYHSITRQVAASDHIALAEFVGRDVDAHTMLDGVHPNAEGYRRMATVVGDAIAGLGVLDGRTP